MSLDAVVVGLYEVKLGSTAGLKWKTTGYPQLANQVGSIRVTKLCTAVLHIRSKDSRPPLDRNPATQEKGCTATLPRCAYVEREYIQAHLELCCVNAERLRSKEHLESWVNERGMDLDLNGAQIERTLPSHLPHAHIIVSIKTKVPQT